MKSWSTAWTSCHPELQLLYPESHPILAHGLTSAECRCSSVWLSVGLSECKQAGIPPLPFQLEGLDAKVVLGNPSGINLEILLEIWWSLQIQLSAGESPPWPQKFPFCKFHTLAEQMVALQISFKSPGLTSKHPFCLP